MREGTICPRVWRPDDGMTRSRSQDSSRVPSRAIGVIEFHNDGLATVQNAFAYWHLFAQSLFCRHAPYAAKAALLDGLHCFRQVAESSWHVKPKQRAAC